MPNDLSDIKAYNILYNCQIALNFFQEILQALLYRMASLLFQFIYMEKALKKDLEEII